MISKIVVEGGMMNGVSVVTNLSSITVMDVADTTLRSISTAIETASALLRVDNCILDTR